MSNSRRNLKNLTGGVDKNAAKKSDSDEKPKDSGFILQVKKITVTQKGEYNYSAVMSRDPPFRVRFHSEKVPTAKVVKSILSFVNRHLRMKFVKDVSITIGKKTDKYKGEKIDGEMDLTKNLVLDEVNVTMT